MGHFPELEREMRNEKNKPSQVNVIEGNRVQILSSEQIKESSPFRGIKEVGTTRGKKKEG